MTASLTPIETDRLQPFTLEGAAVRGRLVRLGVVVDTILSRHAYPDALSKLLGEVLVVASMLSANLKQQGIFTLQLRGNGLVPLLVADAVYGGELRGYAQLSEGAEASIADLTDPTPRDLLGEESYFAITFDPGQGMQRYQGVVALEGNSLGEALQAYFTQSQQLEVWFALACNRLGPEQAWTAGGLMIERVAETGGIRKEEGVDTQGEAWRTALALSNTVQQAEMLDPHLPLEDLLFRLYHEADAHITPAQPLSTGCRCSRQRIYDMLMSMPLKDRADMVVDGHASVTCQFCNQTERFTPEELGMASIQ